MFKKKKKFFFNVHTIPNNTIQIIQKDSNTNQLKKLKNIF